MKNYIAIDRAIDSLPQKPPTPAPYDHTGAGGVKRRDNDRGGNQAEHGEFLAVAEDEVGDRAQRHFENVGMKSQRMNKPETLELARPAETTYFGVQIAFAQDLDRYARRVGADYEEAINFRGSPVPARDSLPPVDRRRPLWYPQHATAAQACRLAAARRDPRVEFSASPRAAAARERNPQAQSQSDASPIGRDGDLLSHR